MNLATPQINTEDAKRLGIEDEALVWVHSRKGKIITRAQVQRSSEQRGDLHDLPVVDWVPVTSWLPKT
ncbi:formate dehydrogenase H alph subunit (formate-hydrogen-lyase-linked selenocysteine-containing polypeptide) [Escherichia coli]|uniref:Formate dehydrogenase H alph subunit (Formate-hydrogen-lyase-linked selenocysteine-containing polypeptide) n=1 Tax=Escherichia coli TaxID=562 RepID=A0A377B7B7_ECOLX|nr:formate dehydrogenase H alph subunit (formate-hydrogen-lyase-linked selenocysteine-containing polypeptide) [Escherichia coli]